MTVANPPLTSRRALGVVSVAFAVLVALALLLPTIRQDAQYHLFADQRAWLGVPRAADVLSNLAFIAVGLFGVLRLSASRRPHFGYATEASLWCVALGFIFTGLGSAWYHLQPNDATLVWDRLPMTLVFAGVIGALLAERVGQNVAPVALVGLILLGAASVAYWRYTGNLTPYGVAQFGGIAALLAILIATRKGSDPFPWWWVAGWYGFAKLAELADQSMWQATGGILAGHAVKHLASAAAGAAVFWPLRAR
jgi:ceramidase